jgi:hypothetical protein
MAPYDSEEIESHGRIAGTHTLCSRQPELKSWPAKHPLWPMFVVVLLSSSRQTLGQYHKFGCSHFRPQLSQFIIHCNQPTIRRYISWATYSVVQ